MVAVDAGPVVGWNLTAIVTRSLPLRRKADFAAFVGAIVSFTVPGFVAVALPVP